MIIIYHYAEIVTIIGIKYLLKLFKLYNILLVKMNEIEQPTKPKRGRKSKKISTSENETKKVEEVKVPKKRGRKPKGGKIITTLPIASSVHIPEPNIILHLRCGKEDLRKETSTFEIGENKYIDNYQFENKANDLVYDTIENSSEESDDANGENNVNLTNKNLSKKINKLAINLHNNNISDKKSACFWCSHDFDNPPIYIPKFELDNLYHCYGCFCSPECATAYLFKENIDSATRFERYHLLNHIYCKIYNYKKNVKPAPDPHYTLDKFYGNLNIQEYRQQLQNERLLLVVDKPLTRILPELHEDNDDFVLNNNSIPSANKFKLRTYQKQSKASVLASTFNLKK